MCDNGVASHACGLLEFGALMFRFTVLVIGICDLGISGVGHGTRFWSLFAESFAVLEDLGFMISELRYYLV